MKPLYSMQEISITRFAIYYLYYKNEQVPNLTWTFVCTADNFYFLSNFDNLPTASPLFANNGQACNTEPGLVAKKGELSKTFLWLFSDAF